MKTRSFCVSTLHVSKLELVTAPARTPQCIPPAVRKRPRLKESDVSTLSSSLDPDISTNVQTSIADALDQRT
jgi:hypothetical protein